MSERAEEVRGECANYTYPSLPTSPALPKNSVSPSTPSERSSTREPATVDGRAPVDGPPSARPVEEIRQLCDAATPGPWLPFFTMHGDPYVVPEGRPWPSSQIAAVSTGPSDYGKADAEFIAAARDLVPSLLAEVEAAHRFEQSAAAESAGLVNTLNGVAAERDALRAEVGELRELTDAARLLGPARRVLDMAAEGEATAEECAAMAQRIVDLIGHPVTDEPPHAIVERDSLRGVVQAVEALRDEMRGAFGASNVSCREIADRLAAALAATREG